MQDYLKQLEDRILEGGLIGYGQAVQLLEMDDWEALFQAADRIRRHYHGNRVDLCTIMNVKSGSCPENCKFCAQSGHYAAGVGEYPLLEVDQIVEQAREYEREGVQRFAPVSSGRGLEGADFERILEVIRELKVRTRLRICGSFGMISAAQAQRLKAAGLDRYHHNLETCEEYFGQICDTHTYAERVETIQNVRAAELEVCCGGIIGLGESMEQRLRMAVAIRELGVKSVPVNVLHPVPGTPLECMPVLEPFEILKTMALFRMILPDAWIRYAGGRLALGELQGKGFKAGVDAALTGNYLTTTGNKISDDLKLIRELGLER